MNTQQTDFLNGYVMSRIAERLAIDKETLVKQVANELSNLFSDKDIAVKNVERSVNQLWSMGFIEVNDAGNITQTDPVTAYQQMGEKTDE